jgi:hypothetical protein
MLNLYQKAKEERKELINISQGEGYWDIGYWAKLNFEQTNKEQGF